MRRWNDASEDKAAVKIRGKREEKRNKKSPCKTSLAAAIPKGMDVLQGRGYCSMFSFGCKGKNERKGEITDENDRGIGDGTDGDFCSPGAGQISQLYSGTKDL